MRACRALAAAAVAAVVASFSASPSPASSSALSFPASAAADGDWVCDAYDQTAKRSRTPEPDGSGQVFPVVTIHGITGSDEDFDGTIDKSYTGVNPQPPRSLLDALAGPKVAGQTVPLGLPGVRVFSFSYTPDSLRWIDNDKVGLKFAETIDCLYEKFGVPVSVIAHSMGGLVTRWVANSSDAQGVSRATKLGKVITLGTPYEGSWLSAIANGATDVVGLNLSGVSLLNFLCGKSGTNTGEGECGPIPLYSSFRSEAGRNLRIGSEAIKNLARWPAGMDVATIAGSIQMPLALLGSPRNTTIELGDLVVGTSSATADPKAARVFECRYDSAASSGVTALKEVLKVADPKDRQAKLTGALTGSPCYHSNLMRHVDLTNEVLLQMLDWLAANRAAPKAPDWESIKGASIPSECSNPPTTLVDGKNVTLAPNEGIFELLQVLENSEPGLVQGVPSDDAGPLTAVVVRCNAGGTGWPDSVIFFSAGGKHYGTSYLYGVSEGEPNWEDLDLRGPGRDGVRRIRLKDGELEVLTLAENETDASCCPSTAAIVRLRATGGKILITSIVEDLGD